MLFRQNINGGAFCEKVQHHLARHFAWIGTDTFCCYAMICCEDVNRLP